MEKGVWEAKRLIRAAGFLFAILALFFIIMSAVSDQKYIGAGLLCLIAEIGCFSYDRGKAAFGIRATVVAVICVFALRCITQLILGWPQ